MRLARVGGPTPAFAMARRLCAPLLTAALAAGVSAGLCAQSAPDPHAVQPERPSVATHAGTVAPEWLEIETGLEIDGLEGSGNSIGIPTALKLGLAPGLQLGLSLPGSRPDGSTAGIGDLSAGVKWRLFDGAAVVHDLAVLSAVKLPTGSTGAGRGTGTTDLSLLLISSRTVGIVSLDLNIGYTIRSGSGRNAPTHSSMWAVAVGLPVRGPLGLAAEISGLPATSGPAGAPGTIEVLAGPTLLVRPWLAFDAGVILPLSGPQPHAIYAGGVLNAGRL